MGRQCRDAKRYKRYKCCWCRDFPTGEKFWWRTYIENNDNSSQPFSIGTAWKTIASYVDESNGSGIIDININSIHKDNEQMIISDNDQMILEDNEQIIIEDNEQIILEDKLD